MPPRSTRSTSGIQRTTPPDVQRLITRLNNDDIIALGDQPGWPSNNPRVSLVPLGMTLLDTKAVVTAALGSKSLRFAKLRGTMLVDSGAANAKKHTEVLYLIARLLPQSNLLCLNIGEWGDASDEAYRRITESLPHTTVGNLYWNRPGNAPQYVAPATAHLRKNRLKDFYKLESLRREIRQFAIGGCQAWWSLTNVAGVRPNFFQRVDTELNDTNPTARCKTRCKLMRCHGLNKAGLRCCLCTRHSSNYCHHHRAKPYPR
jgi:hypothetical protein